VQFVVRPAGPGEPGPMLAVIHGGRTGCVAPTADTVTASLISAVCGSTLVQIVITQKDQDNNVAGRVVIRPA
jgi:hypothetical protein